MRTALIRSWFRALLVQASWNYERMTGVGIAFASEPILRQILAKTDAKKYREALGRATAQFNSHPYFAGAAIGALTQVERQGVAPEHIARFRTALAGPLGSVGDKLVWAGSLPVASAVGLTLAVVVSPITGVVCLLLLHNAVNVTLRIWALKAGWAGGIHVASGLSVPTLERGLRVAGPATAFAVGVMLPLATAWLVRDFEPPAVTGAGLVAGVGLILARWLWPTLGGIRYGLVLVVIAALAGWI